MNNFMREVFRILKSVIIDGYKEVKLTIIQTKKLHNERNNKF